MLKRSSAGTEQGSLVERGRSAAGAEAENNDSSEKLSRPLNFIIGLIVLLVLYAAFLIACKALSGM